MALNEQLCRAPEVFSSLMRYMVQRSVQYVMSKIETDAELIMITSRNRRFKFYQMIRTLEIGLERTHDKAAGAKVLLFSGTTNLVIDICFFSHSLKRN